MSDWTEWNVGELEKKGLLLVQDGNHGEYRPRKNEFSNDGVAFIRAADLGASLVQFESAEKINDIAFNRIRKGVGKDLDTILSTKGTVGKLAFVPEGSPDFVCSPQTSFWRSLNHEFIVPDFLYYELQSRHFLNQISSRKGETDMADYLSLTSQRGLTIRVPDKAVQIAIVEILSSIDSKIQINRQTNQTLEQIAQAIFKSWFVDFDPTRTKIAAKVNGQDPERAAMGAISGKTLEELEQLAPEQIEQLRSTAALFPDALVDSELGEIPEGWEVSTLGKEIDFATGFAFKSKDFSDQGVRLARGDNVKEGRFFWGEKTRYWPMITSDTEKYLLKSGDVLIGMDGSKVGKNWVRVGSSDLPCLLVQRVARLRGNGSIGSSMLEVLISSVSFRRYVDSVKTGTSIPHISGKQIKELPVINPNDNGKLFAKFEALLNPLAEKRENNSTENNVLESTRDTLLPKLLSGELPPHTQTHAPNIKSDMLNPEQQLTEGSY
ncbi:MAG: restriction endonuclease subunit S [Endozoicomonas sp.]|uniref:restriction endonuclease subunit S n=1 Tax=Endozoicomonas sp. TaxID=1892382 RepID=UPI003D9B1B0F